MAYPLTSQAFSQIYGGAENVPIWVHVKGDTYRLTTLGEYWSDVYNNCGVRWEVHQEDPCYDNEDYDSPEPVPISHVWGPYCLIHQADWPCYVHVIYPPREDPV